jgi:hypothetical protein
MNPLPQPGCAGLKQPEPGWRIRISGHHRSTATIDQICEYSGLNESELKSISRVEEVHPAYQRREEKLDNLVR